MIAGIGFDRHFRLLKVQCVGCETAYQSGYGSSPEQIGGVQLPGHRVATGRPGFHLVVADCYEPGLHRIFQVVGHFELFAGITPFPGEHYAFGVGLVDFEGVASTPVQPEQQLRR